MCSWDIVALVAFFASIVLFLHRQSRHRKRMRQLSHKELTTD